MNILIIDTSTERSVVALVKSSKLSHYQELEVGYQSSQYLIGAVEQVLDRCELKYENLNAVAIGIGPGSFTGIRVGVSFAKGLAFARKIPLIPFDSLEGYISVQQGKFASLIDARIGVYLSIRLRQGSNIISLEKSHFSLLSDALLKINDCLEIICPYARSLKDKMHSLPLIEKPLDLEYLTQNVVIKFINKNFVVDGNLPLTYLRHGDYCKLANSR